MSVISIIVAPLASPIVDDDADDNGDNDDDDYEEDDGDSPGHHNYHRNILCISSCALIAIIVASLALQVVSNVPFDFYKEKERKDRSQDDIGVRMVIVHALMSIIAASSASPAVA